MAASFLPSPRPSPLLNCRRRFSPFRYRPFICCSRARRPITSASSSDRPSSEVQKDFTSKILENNPSLVERRILVGDHLLTQSEKASARWWPSVRPAVKEEEAAKEPVLLNDILREYDGKFYVPTEAFKGTGLSELEEFNRNVKLLPKMEAGHFLTFMRAGKVELLTFRTPPFLLPRTFIVDLKEVPGAKELQRTKWVVRLKPDQVQMVMREYDGQKYAIEASYVEKILNMEYYSPVATSISNRIVVELAMVTALIAAAAFVGTLLSSSVFVGTILLYAVCAKFLFPFCRPLAGSILSSLISIAVQIDRKIFDIYYGAIDFVKSIPDLTTAYFNSQPTSDLRLLKPILTILVGMVLLFRFILSRRPKNFRKWDIWQGIEFSQSKPQARVDGSTGVLFSDVAGIDDAVGELQELVEYLKNPKLFDEKGIKPPHGVLLEGPPGCGKTLVAKAIAGEAGVPFYQMAGSEFIEILVGVGSARVRDLFKRAKVNKPSVVFIDEIDALATRRQGIFNETKDDIYNAGIQERETTLNQLLIELDGFDTGKGVIFLGATNRMDLLDPALLRPGRFDRKIRIRPPRAKGRLDILKVHARKVKISPTVDLSIYAQNLPGWSGAKLAQLLQEAALVAVRNKHSSILPSDLDDAVDKLTIGPKRLGIQLSYEGQCRRAITEVGTAITSHLLRRYEAAKVEFCERISLYPRGQTYAQVVFRRLDDEAYEWERKPQLLHRLQVLLGARASEEVVFGLDTSKASLNYLADASWLARKIISIWNLENPMTIHGDGCPWEKKVQFIGPRLDFEGILYSDYDLVEPSINLDLDDEVAKRTEELVDEMYKKTVSLLRRHQAALVKTVKVLLERKEINGDHMEYILDQYPINTPVALVLEENNPGSLPFFKIQEEQRELVFSQSTENEL